MYTGSPRSVLLVEDHCGFKEEMREILRHAGCVVIGEARNTDDALAKLERLQPHAMVMDITLPGSYDSLLAIQRVCRLSPETIVFATGSASQSGLMMEALTMGAVDFFLKPFQPRTIRTALQHHL
jgi:DNA-binding NarL/FixJ family response regulator